MIDKYLNHNFAQPFVLGVTGSIGCGKTTVIKEISNVLIKRNYAVSEINIDSVRRDIMGTNPKYSAVRSYLSNKFGEHIQKDDGSIDRLLLNEIIYSDEGCMIQYRETIKPYLFTAVNDLKNVLFVPFEKNIILLEWALLVEDDMLTFTDYNALLVNCDKDVQLSRLADGDLSYGEIKNRISMQMSNEEKLKEIAKIQEIVNQGYLFTFDTTNSPSELQYNELCDGILEEIS